MMSENWEYRRGDIYYADLPHYDGSEQSGKRPVVVLQNNTGNHYAPTLIVSPLTTRIWKKRIQPTHYHLMDNPIAGKQSMVMLEQVLTIDKSRILRYLGQTSHRDQFGIDQALMRSLDIKDSSMKWDQHS